MERATRAAATVLAAWTIILAVVLVAGWLLTHMLASSVDPWDNDVSRWFAHERTPELNGVADVGTFLGETPVGMGVAAVVAAVVSLWKRSIRPAAFLAVVVAGIGGFYWVATTLITRQRPPVPILDPGLVADDSFPSGHVATAVAVYGGTALLCWWLLPRTRPWVWVLMLVPAFVALSRLYQGAHHLTDVLSSVFYTSAWLVVVAGMLGLRSGGSPVVVAAGDGSTEQDHPDDHERHRHPAGEHRHDATRAVGGLQLDVEGRRPVDERHRSPGGRDDGGGESAPAADDRLHPCTSSSDPRRGIVDGSGAR